MEYLDNGHKIPGVGQGITAILHGLRIDRVNERAHTGIKFRMPKPSRDLMGYERPSPNKFVVSLPRWMMTQITRDKQAKQNSRLKISFKELTRTTG